MLEEELRLLMHELMKINNAIFKETDYSYFLSLCEQDITIISQVHSFAPITAKEISDKLRIPKTTVVTAVARLEKRGFIVRKIDEEDRRRRFLYLTEMGEKAHHQHMQYEEKYIGAFARLWEEEDRELLIEVLRRRKKIDESL